MSDDHIMTFRQPSWPEKWAPPFELPKPSPAERMKLALLGKLPKRYATRRGWRVDGVFEDQEHRHGLCFNPHLNSWFYLFWDLKGRCKVCNCGDSKWDLVELQEEASK
jgi:hypothetical protein